MILAGITVFNPDAEVLKRNIQAILPQVDRLICVDNGGDNRQRIREEMENLFPSVEWVGDGQNRGVAEALNQMFCYAKEHTMEWVLTLDQDSVCPPNMIEEYKKYMDVKDLGSLCPVICDRHYENREDVQDDCTQMDKCITSASLTSVKVWEAVGGFLGDLFIDFVDHDFSAKLIKQKLQIIRVNSVLLEHEIGNGKTVSFFGKKITVLNHGPMRKYYMVRNWIYYIKEHGKVINVPMEWLKLFFLFVKTAIYEENKLQKLRAMCQGLRDARSFCNKIRVKGMSEI